MKKKIVSAMLIAAMATSMFAGCGSSASSNSTTGTASTEASTEGSVSTSDGSTLRINLASEPDKLDPALNTTVDGAALAANSFVGLFIFDKDSNPVPALVSDYTVSDDGLTYTFTLKDGLKWSDGSDLTAADFEYSWKRAADPQTAADYSYLFDVFAKDGVLGFAPCFKMAALMMVLGGLWYIFVCWRFFGDLGKLPFKKTLTEEEKAAEAKKKEEAGTKQPLTTIEKKRIGAIFVASLFSIVFWIFWYLGYMPVYFYWAENMDWVVAGYQVPSTWFDAANSLFCVILGPVTAALWKKLAARPQGDMSLFRKTGLGIAIIGVGYLFYAAIDIMRGGEKASVLWLIVFAFLLTMGEMFFSPLGHSFISKYSPSRYLAVMMSVWGFATFIAAKSYGPVYGLLFGGKIEFKVACIGVAVVSFAAALIMIALDKKLSALVD